MLQPLQGAFRPINCYRLILEEFPDFITFLRHHMAHIENQLITSNNWVVLGGASEKHVPL